MKIIIANALRSIADRLAPRSVTITVNADAADFVRSIRRAAGGAL